MGLNIFIVGLACCYNVVVIYKHKNNNLKVE